MIVPPNNSNPNGGLSSQEHPVGASSFIGPLSIALICFSQPFYQESQLQEGLVVLRSLEEQWPRKSLDPYHEGRHRRLHPALVDLMIAHKRGTKLICAEIDQYGATHPYYAQALQDVLAVTKDPDSCEWYDKNEYIPRWESYLGGAHCRELRWLENPDKWSTCFQRVYFRAADEPTRRGTLLMMLAWLGDSSNTRQFFLELERDTGGESLALVELYLHKHNLALNPHKFAEMLTYLWNAGPAPFVLYATHFRHERFVPGLLKLWSEDMPGAEKAFRRTTCLASETIGEARTWHKATLQQRHADWAAACIDLIKSLYVTDPDQCLSYLVNADQIVDCEHFLPLAALLSKDPKLAPYCVQWAYRASRTFMCDQFQKVAKDIAENHMAELTELERGFLMELGILEGFSWQSFVREQVGRY